MSKRWLSSVDRAQREVLPLHLSLYHAARDYPGGIKAVAAVHGLNPNTLAHKLAPTDTRHRLALDDLEAVLAVTRDHRILDSLGEIAGGCLWVCPVERRRTPRENDQRDVLETMAVLHERLGEMIESVRHSLEDGVIDEHERAELRLRTRHVLETVLLLEITAGGGEVAHG
jgi:hypothetical protein